MPLAPSARPFLAALVALVSFGPAMAADPLASNNGLYPEAPEYDGTYNVANLDYPQALPVGAGAVWASSEPLTVEQAPAYAARLKAFLDDDMRSLINDNRSWDPVARGWYDLVWSGEGKPGADGRTDPNSGREALMNTYTGQIMPPTTFDEPVPKTAVQNHAVIYYNDVAAYTLGQVFADFYNPRLSAMPFKDGAIVMKVEAATPTPEEWPVLDGASTWQVYRPTVEDQMSPTAEQRPHVLTVRPLQMSLRVKDPVAAPETGWVFVAFTYKADAPGDTPWDKFVPVGMQWGNDPQFANLPNGRPDDAPLRETWVNAEAPTFIHDTLGWGGRLSGPMDVSTRRNVILPDGTRYGRDNGLRVSSCQSCHSAAEFPFSVNLYPSPNKIFPRDGEPFLLYKPGSAEWAEWFQNRPGNQPFSRNRGATALDYDMALMFALSSFNAAAGNDLFVQFDFDVH